MIQQDLEEELSKASEDAVYRKIRTDIIASLHRYVFHGIRPGSFLEAVLCNDLCEAVGRADWENSAVLKEIVIYCYQELPGTCWGSEERFREWPGLFTR